MELTMPMENQSSPLPELPGPIPQNAEAPFGIPQDSAEFRTVPNTAEDFGKVPQVAERKENHTLTVREVARMFEAAGVARTERSVINWCQPNRQGITRLDSYYDPNERKYYITPQSVEAVIQEEIQRAKRTPETTGSEPFRSSVAHVKHTRASLNTAEDRRIPDLEREVQNLEIANQVKDQFINLMKNERAGYIEKLETANRTLGQLEAKLLQLESSPHLRITE
jgi:hypothetical protein